MSKFLTIATEYFGQIRTFFAEKSGQSPVKKFFNFQAFVRLDFFLTKLAPASQVLLWGPRRGLTEIMSNQVENCGNQSLEESRSRTTAGLGNGCFWLYQKSTNEMSTIKKSGEELTLMTFGTRTRKRFRIWNIRTMSEATKLAQIAREFRTYKFELVGLSKTRRKESSERRLSTGETLF